MKNESRGLTTQTEELRNRKMKKKRVKSTEIPLWDEEAKSSNLGGAEKENFENDLKGKSQKKEEVDFEAQKEKKKKRRARGKKRLKQLAPALVFLGISIIILAIFLILRTNVEICEFMTKNVMGKINSFVGGIAEKLPFSAFELFVVFCLCVLFVLILTMIILAVKKKGVISLKILCSIVGIAFLFGSYYVLVAGFAYNRQPIQEFCPDYQPDYWEFYDIAKWYKADYDALGEKMERDENGLSICPYTNDELNVLLKAEVKRLDGYFNVDGCFSVKPMKLFSGYMSDTRISGITFMPTGDSGVNNLMPSVQYPSTAMHEMMHSVGIMRENEANFMACYLLISSENDYLRYCGYIDFYGYLYQGLLLNATAEELNSVGVSAKVYKESQLIREFWASQKSFWDKIGDFFNDLYLKLSGQKEGTGSYGEATKPGNDSYEEGDRVFVNVLYNNFQQAFIKNYLEKNGK